MRVSKSKFKAQALEYFREVERSGREMIVTDRGRPVATLTALDARSLSTPFSERRILPEFDALPAISGDSSTYISEDRSRE